MSEDRIEIFIFERPMYRVIVSIHGLDVDLDIQLTAKGKRYARGRGRGFHHFMRDDEDALAEIIHARDNFYPTQAERRPDRTFESRRFENA
jgi:hypothetical protein